MIESIHISGVASYGKNPEQLSNLSSFNFIYGSNGCGKTTISRLIADEGGYPSCRLAWKGGVRLETLVYNRDFVARNFAPSSELKGIFTLGEKSTETLDKIAEAKREHAKVGQLILQLKETLNGPGGKLGERSELERRFTDIAWKQKKKHDDNFAVAFSGLRGNSENFKSRILREHSSNVAAVVPLKELQERSITVYGATPTTEPLIASLSTERIISFESNTILKKPVVGKEDVDIAAMIQKLGNSDWVKEGRKYFELNDGACPFCQQKTEQAFTKSLTEYFDETFLAESGRIDKLFENYKLEAESIHSQLTAMLAAPSSFLNSEAVRVQKELLDARLTINIQHLESKKREPSHVVELESLAGIFGTIIDLVSAANILIRKHNETVANIGQEKIDLTDQVWKYIVGTELKDELREYDSKKNALDRAIESISVKINDLEREALQKLAELSAFEREVTSVQPTVDAINVLLSSFGFHGFSLAKAEVGHFYTLRRPDGSDARETLSEGERTFITFLYFYHLLKGSNSESGVTTDRVAVFDDPVSSLDSDILFIVSSLIKGLFEEVRNQRGHLKQIFILTHNVYFHKEITFNPKRNDRVAMRSEETFWVVRKSNHNSKIEGHASNPIVTSYELLWAEVRKGERSNLSIQNTLRRILENYFKIMGCIDFDEICDLFEGRERLVCKSLFSWVNDGSHHVHDDLYIAIDEAMVDIHLRIFREIFNKSKHLAHYRMMMRDAYVEEVEEQPADSHVAIATV